MTSDSAAASPFLERPRLFGLVGDEARQRRAWQAAFFVVLAALAVSTAVLARLSTRSRVQPVVVLVDGVGRAELLGPAERLPAAERERVVRSQVGLLIRNLRSVYPEPGAQAELLRRGYAYLAPEGAQAMNAYFGDPANDPRERAREISREVRIRSVGPIPGTRSWRVQWMEVETPHGGGTARITAWEAYVSLRESPPVTPEEAAANPLGLRATAIHWTPVTQGAEP